MIPRSPQIEREGDKMYIEKHLFENKNHTVRTEYRVYKSPFTYEIKNRLTAPEQKAFKENGNTIYHF